MSDGLDIGQGIVIPLNEIELRAGRSGGPGGQHANKTESRIDAVFDVYASTVLSDAQKARIAARLGPRVTAGSQESRGQAGNRAIALERLRTRLQEAIAPRKRRTATRPGRGAKERRLKAKRLRSERKQSRRRPPQDD